MCGQYKKWKKIMRKEIEKEVIDATSYQQMAFAWGLVYDVENDVIYGKRNGYHILVYTAEVGCAHPLWFKLSISVTSSQHTIIQVKNMLAETSETFIQDILCSGTKMTVLFDDMPDLESAQTRVGKVLDLLIAYLAENKFESCCEKCGATGDTGFLQMRLDYGHFCAACEKLTEEELEVAAKQTAAAARKKIYIKAGILMLFGILAGGIPLFFVLRISLSERLGYFALWSFLIVIMVAGMVKNGRLV